MNATGGISYVCQPQTWWVVQPDGILLIREDTQAFDRVAYPAAALWDCMVRGQTYAQTVRLLHAMTAGEKSAVEQFIATQLAIWLEHGWLCRQPEAGEG